MAATSRAPVLVLQQGAAQVIQILCGQVRNGFRAGDALLAVAGSAQTKPLRRGLRAGDGRQQRRACSGKRPGDRIGHGGGA
jgi:hypothetical protein